MKKILLTLIFILSLFILVSCNYFIKYRVSFYYEGNLENEIEVKKNSLLEEPEVNVKEGFYIEGWYKNLEEETSKWRFDLDKVTNHIRLDAKVLMKDNYLMVENVHLENNYLKWDLIPEASYYIGTHLLLEPKFDLNNLNLKDNEEVEISINVIKDEYKSIPVDKIIGFNDLKIIESYDLGFEEFDLSEFKELNRSTYKSSEINLDDHHLFVNEGRLTNTNEATSLGREDVSLILRKEGYLEFLASFKNLNSLVFNLSGRNKNVNNSKLEILVKNINSNYILVKEIEILEAGFKQVTLTKNEIETFVNINEDIYFKFNTIIKDENASNNIVIDDILFKEEVSSSYYLKNIIEDNITLSDYYKSAENLEGKALVDELRIIITTNINDISYKDIKEVLEYSDKAENNNDKVLGIYDGILHKANWGSKSEWHREHVWPNSRLGMDRVKENEVNQGSDPHNLRAITPRTNSSRSNRFYDNTNLAETLGHTLEGGKYYPGDNDKGDVARILMYMVVRYDFLGLTNNLELLGKKAYTSEAAFMGLLNPLLSWHEDDKVDNFEINRNDVIYSYQGNRNPFIDHPELFTKVYSYFLEVDNNREITLKSNLIDSVDVIFIKRYNYIDNLSI